MPDNIPSFSLAGKVIVQCGGSGLLGRGLVAAIAGSGATLILTSRERARAEGIAAEEKAAGRTVFAEETDLDSEAAIKATVERVLQAHQRIDGMVFNAVRRGMGSWGADLKQWEESMATNATGFFAGLRAFGDVMAKQGGGSIVNIASMYGLVGYNPWLYEGTPMGSAPDYFFHKAGMINVTRFAATYYGGRKVRVNVVAPGGIYNPNKPQHPLFLEHYAKMTALGRMGDVQEMTGAVVFLLSDAATYVTGTTITVDGGYTIR
jgi:NAD(P)-dependent dehydrogenase (short-subunit alcohol dehydrogenase family)